MDRDYQLLRQIQDGDEQALARLMEYHKESVFRFACHYTGNYTDAQEIAEETFVRVYFAAGRFRPRGKVKTWIFTVAANLARDYLRRNKKSLSLRSLDQPIDKEHGVSLSEVTPSAERTSAEEVESQENLRAAEDAIQALPQKLRFPLVFCVLEGNSYAECARVLGCSVKTVDARIYRARRKLRYSLSHIR